MKIFITGIDGFVGSYLTEYLIMYYPEAQIHGLVLPDSTLTNIFQIKDKINFTQGNILNYQKLASFIESIKPDLIFHLAAKISPRYVAEVSEQMMEINITGTLNLLKATRKHAPEAKVFIASSAAVYGNTPEINLPVKETCAYAPIEAYGSSKACAEILSIQYFKTFGLQTTVARTFNLLAPARGQTFIENNFLSQIKTIKTGNAEPIINTGDIDTYRDFLDVRDAVRAYVELMKYGKPGEIYNVCSNKMVSVQHILELLLQNSNLKNKVRIFRDPRHVRPIDIRKSVGSNAKILNQTIWRPQIPIEQSLIELLKAHK